LKFFNSSRVSAIAAAVLFFAVGFALVGPSFAASADKMKGTLDGLKERGVSELAAARVADYAAKSVSARAKQGLEALLEEGLERKLAKAREQIAAIKIDGKTSDWDKTNFYQIDEQYDFGNLDPEKEMNETPDITDDVNRYGFVMDEANAYFMFEPVGTPGAGSKYHYKVNILDFEGKPIYTVGWSDSGNYVEKLDPSSGRSLSKESPAGAEFAGKGSFEARVPAQYFKGLPYVFDVKALVYHDFKNASDECHKLLKEQPIGEKYKKCALELFCRYAEKSDLTPDDPFPLAQAITDAHLYKCAEDKLRPQVVADGIEMANFAKKKSKIGFDGQKPLAELGLAEILAWSNREVMQGGYSCTQNYQAARNERLNKDAYEFIALRVSDLEKCLELIEKNKLASGNDLPKTIRKIEKWLTEKEKYRRVNIDDLAVLSEFDPAFKATFEEAQAEQNEKNNFALTINGVRIDKGTVFTPTFQIDCLVKKGYYFGNCVDVAATAIAFYKALHVPALAITYGAHAEKYYFDIHTFAIYFCSGENGWFTFERAGNEIYRFATVESIDKYKVLYFIHAPQAGSHWSHAIKYFDGATVYMTSRSRAKVVELDDWRKSNRKGFPADEVAKAILE